MIYTFTHIHTHTHSISQQKHSSKHLFILQPKHLPESRIRECPGEWKAPLPRVVVQSLSRVGLLVILQTIALQAHLSMEFPRQNTGEGCYFLLQGIFPATGSNPGLLHCRWVLGRWTTREARVVKRLRKHLGSGPGAPCLPSPLALCLPLQSFQQANNPFGLLHVTPFSNLPNLGFAIYPFQACFCA